MGLEIIPVFNRLDAYINEMERPGADVEALWDKYAVEPYWQKLCEYAPMDIRSRKPKPVCDAGSLKEKLDLLNRMDIGRLKADFEHIASSLPYEGQMRVALYPTDNYWVRMAQNGVLGTCTWGHMIISIDPLAVDYEAWIPYVFGHEYHHNVWGWYWHSQHRGELEYMFINDLLCDGLADTFALSFYPELRPKWLFDISDEAVRALWNRDYALLIKRTDVDYNKYMIGDDIDIPWCAGYAIGFRIVRQYLITNPQTTMKELLELRPIDIYKQSGYAELMKRRK